MLYCSTLLIPLLPLFPFLYLQEFKGLFYTPPYLLEERVDTKMKQNNNKKVTLQPKAGRGSKQDSTITQSKISTFYKLLLLLPPPSPPPTEETREAQ